VALEGDDVPIEQGLLCGVELTGRRVVGCAGGERGPGPLQRAVDGGHTGAEQLRHLGGRPPEHLPQDQHRPLPGREVLEGDE
jgi:hypothetical protein